MTTVEFLASLNSLGIKIWLEDNQLRYRAAKGVMTASIKQELVERKTEIIKFLKETENCQLLNYEPIISITKDFDLPLSFPQQRLWFLHHLDSNSAFYNESFQIRIIGLLNVTALEQSLNEIIRRHEALRTIFPTVEGLPVQRITPCLTINLPVVDLQGLKEAEVQQIITKEVRQPFDLSKPPLLRASLLRLGSESHLLILTIHHMVIDGWSMGILIEELSALYQAFSIGSPTPLPELTIQYGDFTVWQRQGLTEQLQQKQLDYWKQQLADAPQLLELPTDYPRPSVQSFSGAIQTFQINSNLTAKLKNISQQSGTTLFVTLLATFSILLHRYSGQDDICIGSPFANRNRTELESLIGFFVNTLVLRTQIKENPNFLEFVAQVQQVVLDAYAHQDVPFDQVVEALQPERSLSYNPLFQVMFVLENFALDAVELPGITLTPELVERGTAQCDLSLAFWETKTGLQGSWEYNTDLFEADTIARMTGHFQTLLEAIATNPKQPISELPLLTQQEQRQLLVEWNNTTTEYPFDKCIHHLFEEQVERSPDAVAVVFEGEQLTYRELNAKANQLAHYLQSLGMKPEVLVGICVERSLAMIIGLLGILKAGGAYVPLDPNYPSERLAFMLEDSSVPVLLTQQKLVEKLPPNSARVICLDSDWEEIAFHNQENPSSPVKPENLAYVIYTSGSTGKPKGVLIEHKSLVNYTTAASAEYAIIERDRILQFSSISFDVSAEEIYTSLASGATLVLRTDTILDSIDGFLQQCQNWEVTVLALPTAYWHELTAFLSQRTLALPPSLRLVILGGEKALPERL
ncbi:MULTISPECIES: condensation domain-containing protein, partial [Aerosakkonema]|uniref:non-ribosomal peptide synthetase n=1 Tax=Aerosakkonema TaxID=1246629 RepID=UPI0035B7FD67